MPVQAFESRALAEQEKWQRHVRDKKGCPLPLAGAGFPSVLYCTFAGASVPRKHVAIIALPVFDFRNSCVSTCTLRSKQETELQKYNVKRTRSWRLSTKQVTTKLWKNRLSATKLCIVELRCWFKEDVLECTQLEVRGFELLGASSSELGKARPKLGQWNT